MDTQTQIDRLIELAIIQRSELKQLVEQLPQLREHLNAEVEKVFDETEPQLRAELEEWTTKQTADKTAALGVTLEAKIADLAKSLEISTQARYNAIIAEREENARLSAQAEAKIAEHAASLPSAVKDIVTAELARFPRAGEIDQLRKEFAEPRGLNPRGKWKAGETYNKLDLVTINGDSYTSNIYNNRTRPSRSSADWTLVAARGTGGGGGPTSLSELTTVPSDGDVLIGSGTSWVTSNLTAGAGISITVGPGAITISATDGDITLDDGTAASPSLHFTNDPDTGIYRPAANTLGISTSGVQRMYVDENGITTVGAGGTFDGSVHAANGNANNPSFSFTSDQDTGFYRHGTNELGISIGGTEKAVMTSTTFTVTPNLVVSGTGSINGTTIPASKTLVVTTDKLSALASTSSAELAGVISDETGTGALVFANTPTLVTPVIGAATGTSLTVTGNVTASDTILGTSGPSVKSTLSARAPRQGLVFDGTAGATVSGVPAFGTNPFSYVVFIRPNQMPSVASAIIRGAANSADLGYLTNGTIQLNKADVSNTLSTPSGQISAGKTACIVYTRDSGTGTFYVNGVSVASGSDSVDYSAATTVIGGTAPTYIHNGFIYALIYNRALSASEVVALYEAGAPSGADYNSAGTERATTNWVNAGTAFTSFSSSGATAFTVTAGASQGRAESRATFALSVGQRVRLTGSVASLSGTADCYLVTSGGTLGSAVTSSAVSANGTFTIEVTATVTDSAMRIALGSAGAWAGTFTSLSLKNTGLLLAPDAAQAGGGLTWYDTSGNAANITLPASGVSWNVPSSRVLGGNWTTSGNLTVSGTGLSSVAGAMKVGGTATFTGAGLELQYVAGGGNYGYFRNYNRTSSVYERLYVDGFLTILNSDSGGNVLIGTTTDGGQKLQVSGTAAVSSTLSVGGNTASQQLHLNVDVYGASKSGGMRIGNSGNNYYSDLLVTTDSSSNPFVKLSFATHQLFQYAYGGGGNSWTFYTNNTTALTLSGSEQSATFAGKAFINGSFTSGALGVRASTSGTNSIVQVATIEATSTGTPTDGFGGSIDFYNKNLFGTGPTIAGRMAAVFKNTGYSNYEGEVSLWTASNGTLYKQLTLSPGGGAAGTSTFAGPIAINNTVQTAAGVSSTHKVTISIGGTTYYLLATNV